MLSIVISYHAVIIEEKRKRNALHRRDFRWKVFNEKPFDAD